MFTFVHKKDSIDTFSNPSPSWLFEENKALRKVLEEKDNQITSLISGFVEGKTELIDVKRQLARKDEENAALASHIELVERKNKELEDELRERPSTVYVVTDDKAKSILAKIYANEEKGDNKCVKAQECTSGNPCSAKAN